ncbi:MAG TPA: 3-hydroxyacyl-CoA dehydrogenase NAD-binding domain-containing protein [Chthoniobacterales bacterium]|nr:3-hydroxyacyl-CoA dehydrogenase NAD-binding domain-containing protein [Chthoniobacterales bacterium]
MSIDEVSLISCEPLLDLRFAERVEAALSDSATSVLLLEFHSRPELATLEVDRILSDDSLVNRLRTLIRKMEQGKKPVVGIIAGSAAGLQLEVMLACHARFAGKGHIELGFPWLSYGLMPVLGSTQRLPRLCGIEFAAGMLLMGRSVTGAAAAASRLLEGTDPDPATVALRWAQVNATPRQPWDSDVVENSPAFSQSVQNRDSLKHIYLKLRQRVTPEETAPAAILHCLHHGLERSIDAGIRLEAEQWSVVRYSRSTLNRVNTLHRARQKALRNLAQRCSPIKRVGVLGAGLMGTGIAYTAARVGCEVHVVDLSDDVCQRSLRRMKKIAEQHSRDAPESMQATADWLDRLHWASEIDALSQCDFIVEAIYEDAALKRAKLAEISRCTDSAAVIASNTTTIPISELALACERPERFLGTHFFAPADRMELLEIVIGEKTVRDSTEAAIDFAHTLGKTPIVVRDGPGFFTGRVVAAYLQEALFMLREGVSPWLIDNVAQNAGMIHGPLSLADLISLDLLKSIFESLAKYGRGAARKSSEAVEIVNEFVLRSRLGRKIGAGIYDYDERQDRIESNALASIFPTAQLQPSSEEIESRLFVIQTIESLHAVREGIIEDAALADLASVLGWSYPAARRGVLGYIDYLGRSTFEQNCTALHRKFGERFLIPPRVLSPK